jgi:Polycystin cation channel
LQIPEDAVAVISNLQAHGFVDSGTAAVFVDINVYNEPLSLIAIVRLSVEQVRGRAAFSPLALCHVQRVLSCVRRYRCTNQILA